MRDLAARILFAAELVLFALPTLSVLIFYAVLLGGASAMAVVSFFRAPILGPMGNWEQILAAGHIALPIVATLLGSLCGLFAMIAFARVAIAYLFGGREAALARQAVFRRGLLWAIPPMLVLLPLGLLMAMSNDPNALMNGLTHSGVGLLIPAFHLWLAIRAARSRQPAAIAAS